VTRITAGVDVSPTIQGTTGISRYATALVQSLPCVDVDVRSFAVGRATVPPATGVRHLPVPSRLMGPLWRATGRPRAERLVGPVDVVHGTSVPPPPSKRPRLVTVHDLAALHHPGLHPRRTVAAMEALVAELPRLAGVLADTETVARELAERGVPLERTTVAPVGRTLLPGPVDPAVDLDAWLLCVGETNRRKNIGLVLDALARSSHRDLGLVVAGPPGNDDGHLRSRAHELGLASRVRFPGSVSDARLAGLYRDALALCYVSFAEGFGLPVVEAMAAGTPVVCSDLPVLREVAGDVATFVDVDDTDALVAAIDAVIALAPASRTARAEAGRTRAGRFTWEACAQATRAAYDRALA